MAQIQSPETYVDGQQVTAARLNNQTNGAILLPGVITDQTNITANTVAAADSFLLYDLSATALREANISDILGSNLPITTSAVTTSSITAGANSDILITPNDGTIVTGQVYSSADGLTVTVTSSAHLLTVGQVILVASAGTGYNGTFRVATVLTNSFTYVMTTAATAGSGTLSYTKKAMIKNPANELVAGNLYVDGSTAVAGNVSVAGGLTVAGATTLTGTTTFSGVLVYTGTANFTGALQVNGVVGYVLTEIQELAFPSQVTAGVGVSTAATTAVFTKPSDEIWAFETSIYVKHTGYNVTLAVRYSSQTMSTGNYLAMEAVQDAGSGATSITRSLNARWVVPAGTVLTAQSLAVDVATSGGAFVFPTSGDGWSAMTGNLPQSVIRIYKYKTA